MTAATPEVRLLQYAIAFVFLTLGAWCLIGPASVIALTVRPEYQDLSPLTVVSVGAFGAQAILGGLFAAFSIFTRRTFLGYGIAQLPFFVLDWWFLYREPIFNELILLDVVGNVAMLALCARGYLVSRPGR
jgi:hypothetical protein